MAGRATTAAAIAREAGARVIDAPRGRGTQLAAGAAAATRRVAAVPACRLPAAARLGGRGRRVYRGFGRARPGISTCALDDAAPAARRLERIVAWRCRALGAALWRPGAADPPRPLRGGRRLRGDPADGGCRFRAPARPRAASRRSARRCWPRRGAIGATAMCGGRCAISSAWRCISPGVPRAIAASLRSCYGMSHRGGHL